MVTTHHFLCYVLAGQQKLVHLHKSGNDFFKSAQGYKRERSEKIPLTVDCTVTIKSQRQSLFMSANPIITVSFIHSGIGWVAYRDMRNICRQGQTRRWEAEKRRQYIRQCQAEKKNRRNTELVGNKWLRKAEIRLKEMTKAKKGTKSGVFEILWSWKIFL